MTETSTRQDERVVIEDTRLSEILKSSQIDIGVLWEVCVVQEFDRLETVDGIAAWLGPPDGQRILDCACGSGFPALDLAKAGYDITASDGSEMMLNHFRRNARVLGVDLEPRLVPWERLVDEYGDTSFDTVLCRGGGSYIYAGTWDANGQPDRSALDRTLAQFARCLKPGGRLYLDTTRAADVSKQTAQWSQSSGLLVDGRRIDVAELVSNDHERHTRTWYSRLSIDGEVFEFERTSHLVLPEELIEMLTRAGLEQITKIDVPGETYDVYVAQRPAT